MIERNIAAEVLEMARYYPIVTILGPRQSGKTTLAKLLFPHKPYVSLENPDELSLAQADPRQFLKRFAEGAIFDEIQRAPFLLSYLQDIVDNCDEKGLYILTGSHQLLLQESIAQSLAGRTAILKLHPLSLEEMDSFKPDMSVHEHLFYGMYPRIYKDGIPPTKFYRDYVQTYIERDLRQLVNVKDLSQFQLFMKLCAGRIGQLFNAHQLSNEVGVSHTTIQHWLSILEASFLIFRLTPYYENFGKRLVKTPKMYFVDVGLATYLLDITEVEQLARDPLQGHLFENMVIMELVKNQLNRGKEPSFYFYRDSNGVEIDCLYRKGHELISIEIKSSQTFDKSFLKGIEAFKQLCPERCPRSYVIYAGEQEQIIQGTQLLNYKHMIEQDLI